MQVPSFLSGESLKRLLQGSAIGFVLTVAIGFNWTGYGFGWVTGGTVDKIADKRAETAVIAVLAPICAEKFLAQPDIAAKKVAFAKVDSWKRRDELAKEWTTLPGGSYQNSDLVDACSAAILKPQVAAAKQGGAVLIDPVARCNEPAWPALHLGRVFAFRGRLFEFVDVRAEAAERFFAICEKIEGRAPPAWLWEAVRRIAARFLHNRDESDPHRAGMAAFEAIQ